MGSVLALARQAPAPQGLREWLVAPHNDVLFPLAAVVAGAAVWGLWAGRQKRGGSAADPTHEADPQTPSNAS